MLPAKTDDESSANLDSDDVVVIGKLVGAMPFMSKKI
jgi:hypothetical protein